MSIPQNPIQRRHQWLVAIAIAFAAAGLARDLRAIESHYEDFVPAETGDWVIDLAGGISAYDRKFGTTPAAGFRPNKSRIAAGGIPSPASYTSYWVQGRITYSSTVFGLPARLLYSVPLRKNVSGDSAFASNSGFDDTEYGFTIWPYSVPDDDRHFGIALLAHAPSGHYQKYQPLYISSARGAGSLIIGYHYRSPWSDAVQLESVASYTKFGRSTTDMGVQTKKDVYEIHQWLGYEFNETYSMNMALKFSAGGALHTSDGGIYQNGSWRDYNSPN
ncbi:MAG: transporter, partial [Alphaproteobacteria bacterium]|nr:transporter [Alphaproteobacteria bacterium]